METLIRRRILWCLIWVCTVCQLPFYGSPDCNGLILFLFLKKKKSLVDPIRSASGTSNEYPQQICFHREIAGLGGSVGCSSNWRPGGRRFDPRRGQQHSFVEIDHEIFSTVILSLPLIQEGQLSVSGKRMCTILVNCLKD